MKIVEGVIINSFYFNIFIKFSYLFSVQQKYVCTTDMTTLKFENERQSKEDIYVKSSIRFCSLFSTKALLCSVIAARFFSRN